MVEYRRHSGSADLCVIHFYFLVSGVRHISQGKRRRRLDDRSCNGCLRRSCGWACQGGCCCQCAAGNDKRFFGGQCGFHRLCYDSTDEKDWISALFCWSGGSGGLDRRTDHAPRYGGRCIHHDRIHRLLLWHNRSGGLYSCVALLYRDFYQCAF